MNKGVPLLIAGCTGLWLVLFYPVKLLWGDAAVVFSAVAALICLVPTTATLIWSERSLKAAPEQQMLAIFGGTGVRMVFVIGVGMVLYYSLPLFNDSRFWIWVVVFYLFTLALEMTLLVSRSSRTDASQGS